MSRQAKAARLYLELGWTVVPVECRQKRPTWEDVKNENVHEYFPAGKEMNIGVRLGAKSENLADVDLDCPEAIALARFYLPSTARFGRETAKASHWIYKLDEPIQTYVAQDEQSSVLVELRSALGDSKVSTVFPPSTHKDTGEAIEWVGDSIPVPCFIRAAGLLACVKRLAIACLILRHGGERAAREWREAGDAPKLPPLVWEYIRNMNNPPVRLSPAKRTATNMGAESLFDAYNRAHQRDWGEPGKGTCPICKHQDCFGRLPEIPSRWSCFSLGHPDGWGVRGDRCTTGDVLDVDAFERFSGMDPKRARMEIIKELQKGAA